MEHVKMQNSYRAFWVGKLFSLVGIVPLGVYVILHLYNNLHSLRGEEAFNAHLASTRSWPGIVPLAILVIWIPIAFHGIVGLMKITQSRPKLGRFPFFTHLKYVIQRLSGLGLLLFVPAHLYKTRLEPLWMGEELTFQHMSEGLHEPLTLAIYLLAVLGVSFHLANGIWQFAIGWGLVLSEQGMRRLQWVSIVIFLGLWMMGLMAIWGFLK